jgi:hypothetical protein
MTYREAFVKRANTHQTHFEDLVLLGPDGIAEVKDKIEKFLATSAGQDVGMNTTTKIDGAPAVICYSKFPGYPDNSICLKSFVANANNVISTEDEIMSKYGDRPSMAEKLVYCLQLAKLIPEGEAWQGDCLFSTDDKKVEEIRGKEYITFQPNKIVYAFSEDNPGYEDVKNAEFGIAFHTVYKDDGHGGKTQSFRPEIDKVLWPNWAYIMSPALNVNKDKFDIDRIKALYQSFVKGADELCADPAYKDLINNEIFMGYWNTFENASLADKKETQLNCETVINDLKEYIAEKQTKEFQKKFTTMKTAKGKMGAIDKWAGDVAEIKEIINYSRETIVHLVEVLNAAAEIKMTMWEGFKTSNHDYSTFYKSRTRGVIDANMEGVAMSDAEGNIVKIVDRSEFSSANRDPDIMAGWEHPGENIKESKDWRFQFKGIDWDVLNEGGVGKLSIDNLNYKGGEYIGAFKSFISEGKPLNWATSGTGEIKGSITIEPSEELLNTEDNAEFADKLKAAILAKEPKAKWIEKPKSSSGIGSQDVTINTDFQEAIQGYLFEHYWESPLQTDSDYVDTLFSEDFKNRINWEICTADFDKFKSDISTTLTQKGYASSNSWLSYFIAIAKTGSAKIQALYKEGHKLQGAPKAFARGLHSSIDAEVNAFFANSLFEKPKDRTNKADILLVFGPNPEQTAKEYIDRCLKASTPEDYSAICDEALSNGTVLGLSLKKGKNEVHAELLATTTSINKEVFGEDAATAVMYYGEEDPRNTFTSFRKTCNTPELMYHIENFKFVPYMSKEDQEGLTAQIYLPVNEAYHDEFSNCIKIGIRTNDREKGAVTVEAYKNGAKAGLGKWPTVMQEELGVSMPSKSRPDMSNYERCVEKINIYLDWFKMVYDSGKADYLIGKFVSSGGYPLANKESGETKLITAPIIKIS